MIQPYEFPIVKRQIRLATDWIIGGYENSISDGHISINDVPGIEFLIEEIYSAVTHNTYVEGGEMAGAIPPIVRENNEMLIKMIIISELLHDDFITDYLNLEGWGD